jgi:hypothetical protein
VHLTKEHSGFEPGRVDVLIEVKEHALGQALLDQVADTLEEDDRATCHVIVPPWFRCQTPQAQNVLLSPLTTSAKGLAGEEGGAFGSGSLEPEAKKHSKRRSAIPQSQK